MRQHGNGFVEFKGEFKGQFTCLVQASLLRTANKYTVPVFRHFMFLDYFWSAQ